MKIHPLPVDNSTTCGQARAVAERVLDPELPVLTLADLGVLRDVREEGGHVTVTITPTYSGCPALDEMRADLRRELLAAGYERVEIRTVLTPAWTTDWISAEGRRKLRASGFAPPAPHPAGQQPLFATITTRPAAACPWCGSGDTALENPFGPTLCRSIYWCNACRQPFEQFKAV